MRVSSSDKSRWGESVIDRKNSFDDSKDIEAFVKMIRDIAPLKKYIRDKLDMNDKLNITFKIHPDGIYSYDFAFYSNDELIAIGDIEHWKQWNPNLPEYYKYASFLDRKSKFLPGGEKNKKGVPFLMVWMNADRTKIMCSTDKEIQKYPTVEKSFAAHNNKVDKVKKVKYKECYLFGNNFSNLEKDRLNYFYS